MSKKKKESGILAVVSVVVIVAVVAIIFTLFKDSGATKVGMSESEAYSSLLNLAKKVDYEKINVKPEQLEVSEFLSTEQELPDIDVSYPLVVEGYGEANVEIFSSGEKASKSGNDSFLTEMAEDFNRQKSKTSDGKQMSISLRSVPSGTSVDYITSGKYVPDCYTPSNDLYGGILVNNGVETTLVTDKLVGNVAGVIVNNTTYKKLFADLESVSITDIVDAVIDGKMTMGYSNPNTSATGLNFLLTTLSLCDSGNMLSDEATAKFESFQAKIPLVSYTTQQLTSSGEKGIINAMVCEYQSYVNSAVLSKNYTFIPFGVPHNNPLYAVRNLSDAQNETIKAFAEYCEKNSSDADSKGFNKMDYTNTASYSGSEIEQAQTIYKEVKAASKTIVAEFIVDISGSMAGEPINNLKTAMINTIQYINDESYIGVLAFDSYVYEYLPIAPFDLTQKTLYKGAVNGLDAGGTTYMYEAIVMGLKNVSEKCSELNKQGIDTKPIIFVLTDGEDNGDYTYGKCQNVIDGMNIPIYTISYNYSSDSLDKLSSLNEGASISGTSDDIIYKLKQLFNSEM